MSSYPKAARAALSQLAFASKLLIGSVLVQALLFLPKSMMDPQLKFNLVWFAGVALCVLGFAMANRHMGFTGGLSRLTSSELIFGGHAGRQARASIHLMFYCAFLVPLFNALMALWVLIRIHLAVSAFKREAQETRAREEQRRSKFGPMGS